MSERKYAKSHEWVLVDGETATVGISDHAQDALGDITFVELPEVDEEVEAGSDVASIESVKAASDIYAPIGGTISAVNEDLEDEPEAINENPLDGGWIFKLSDINAGDLDNLMSEDEYNEFLKSN